MRSSAWIWLFSSTHSTTPRSGGFRYRPTTSLSLATNCGSRESLNVSARCGWSPNARQIRCTADCVRPTSAAIDRVDQCVASLGADSSVLVITSSTIASVIVRGCPGRGSSTRPSSRSASNRRRHFATVLRCTPSRAAIAPVRNPSATSNTIFAS